MKRTGPTNTHLQKLIVEMKILSQKEKNDIWNAVAQALNNPSRNRKIVNLSRLNRFTKENETIIIPGKLLGSGSINHKVNVAAYTFSDSAVEKIKQNSGSCMTITELMKKNPKGKDIRIIG